METSLPRPILPIGALREVREIVDRSGVAGPPVEVMPLPVGDFQRSDMTSEMLKDPHLMNFDTFEKTGDDDETTGSPTSGKPAEAEDAAYQLELGAKKAHTKAKSEALETMLAYERLGRSMRRTAPALKPRGEAGAREPVSAPRPPFDGEQGLPSGLLEEPAGDVPVMVAPKGSGETALVDALPQGSAQSTAQGMAQGTAQANIPPSDTPQAPESGVETPNVTRPNVEQHTQIPLPPDGAPPRGRETVTAPRGQAETPPPTQEQGGGEIRVLARSIEVQAATSRTAETQSGAASDSRGSLENLKILTKLPFSLYLFGGEMPRYTDEEEARAIPSRRKRRAAPDWTMESLTMADAVRLAAVLHNIYFGGEGMFEKTDPWYMPFLRYALEQGIIHAGEFGASDDPVTRAHFADILARCVPDAALPVINPLTTVSDVKEGIGYGSSALKMVRAGVFAPVGPLKLFDPERLVTRREAAVYVGRLLTPSDRRRF